MHHSLVNNLTDPNATSLSDDEIRFAEEIESNQVEQSWKILIVDDDSEVHNVTQLALSDYTFEGKILTFINAYSAQEARQLIQLHSDIAIIFVDVVMETDDAGLQLVKYLRDELDNQLVRIILRTGQPGLAPENFVVMNYGVDDYKTKTELTSQKLFTTVTTALRTFSTLVKVLALVQNTESSDIRSDSTSLFRQAPHWKQNQEPAVQPETLTALSQLISEVSDELNYVAHQADSLSTVSVITRIAKTVLRATDEYFAKLGISQSKLAVLMYLSGEPDLCASPSSLANHCDVSRAAMTGLLDALEQEGFVERADHPSDRRSLVIRLTAKGKQFVDGVIPKDQYRLPDLIKVLNAFERKQLFELANSVIKLSQE